MLYGTAEPPQPDVINNNDITSSTVGSVDNQVTSAEKEKEHPNQVPRDVGDVNVRYASSGASSLHNSGFGSLFNADRDWVMGSRFSPSVIAGSESFVDNQMSLGRLGSDSVGGGMVGSCCSCTRLKLARLVSLCLPVCFLHVICMFLFATLKKEDDDCCL